MRFEIHVWKWALGLDLLWALSGGMSIWRRMIFFRLLIGFHPIFNFGLSLRSEGPSFDFRIWPFHLDGSLHYLNLEMRRRTIFKANSFEKKWKTEWRGWRRKKKVGKLNSPR